MPLKKAAWSNPEAKETAADHHVSTIWTMALSKSATTAYCRWWKGNEVTANYSDSRERWVRLVERDKQELEFARKARQYRHIAQRPLREQASGYLRFEERRQYKCIGDGEWRKVKASLWKNQEENDIRRITERVLHPIARDSDSAVGFLRWIGLSQRKCRRERRNSWDCKKGILSCWKMISWFSAHCPRV
jgi:hypothetical protein